MKSVLKTSILGLIFGVLSACGGGGSGEAESASVTAPQGGALVTIPTSTPTATPSPTPTPTTAPAPTPTPTPTPTEERLVLPDNTLYAPGDYFAYAAPWCTAYDPTLIVGQTISDSISLLRSTFPNDVVISASAPDHYPTVSNCGVYGYNYIAFGNYLSANPTAKMQPRQVKAIETLSIAFDMTRAGDGEYSILTESFLTMAAKDFSTRLEVGFFNHSTGNAISYARTGATIGTWTDNAGRSWTVTQAKQYVMFVPAGGGDLLSGTLDVKSAFAFLVARGVLTGDEWFNGVTTGMEPLRGKGEATIRTWSVSYN